MRLALTLTAVLMYTTLSITPAHADGIGNVCKLVGTNYGVAFSERHESGSITTYDVVEARSRQQLVTANCNYRVRVREHELLFCFADEKNRQTFKTALRSKRDSDNGFLTLAIVGLCRLGPTVATSGTEK